MTQDFSIFIFYINSIQRYLAALHLLYSVFLNINTFPFLEEHYPWPVEARDSFTTIQSEMGCRAKHNFNEEYEIINA